MTNDDHINVLLSFMKEEIESHGRSPQTVRFNFDAQGEDLLRFKQVSGLEEEDIVRTLRICHSRGYIKHPYIGPGEIISLTTEGHGRAISYEAAKNYKDKPQQHTVSIGAIHGPTQIGNNNIQNIETVLEHLINEIDTSSSSEESKKEAKSLLQRALAHPITSTIIGSGIGAIISKLGGK